MATIERWRALQTRARAVGLDHVTIAARADLTAQTVGRLLGGRRGGLATSLDAIERVIADHEQALLARLSRQAVAP